MNTIRRTTKSVIRPLVIALALAGLPVATVVSASSATPAASCATAWGSLDKSARRAGSATIINARAGRHACFDRLVIDFKGKGANARVGYLTDIVPGSGAIMAGFRGGAILEVALNAHADDVGAVSVSGFTTFREAAFLGSFRGFARFGLGVRARLPFRVFTLDGPGNGSRLVIDVAHRWSASAAPFCGIRWGSLDKSSGPTTPGLVTSVRAGRHACFDRLVIDFRGKGANASVAYAPRAIEDESGRPLALRGGATMLVTLNARTFDVNTFARTYDPRNPAEAVNVSGFTTLRQVRFEDADIEVVTLFWLGVRARLPFRVFTLDGPGNGSRLVIDVAHQW